MICEHLWRNICVDISVKFHKGEFTYDVNQLNFNLTSHTYYRKTVVFVMPNIIVSLTIFLAFVKELTSSKSILLNLPCIHNLPFFQTTGFLCINWCIGRTSISHDSQQHLQKFQVDKLLAVGSSLPQVVSQ